MTATRMGRSLDELEQEFRRQKALEERRRKALERMAAVRSRQRWHARERKRSSKRFYALAATLVLTAVAVTVAMFATLYLILV